MAGDWIKIEKDTPAKPEILALSGLLSLSPDDILGKLIRLWCWADSQTTDGSIPRLTVASVDALVSHPGFGQAMVEVSWLSGRSGGLFFPNFDRHMGKGAKIRAQTLRRMRNKRETIASPEKEKEKEKSKNPPLKIPPELDNPEFKAAWSRYESYRSESRLRKLKPSSVESQWREMATWGLPVALAAIEESIRNGYQGVFKPKNNGKPVKTEGERKATWNQYKEPLFCDPPQ